MMLKRDYFGYPQGIILQNYADLLAQIQLNILIHNLSMVLIFMRIVTMIRSCMSILMDMRLSGGKVF